MKRKKSNNSTSTTATPEEEILNDDLAEAPAMQENEELDDIAIADEDEASAVLDAAQVVHDNGVIKTVKAWAIAQMAEKGVFIASDEQKRAEGIIPKVHLLNTYLTAYSFSYDRSLDLHDVLMIQAVYSSQSLNVLLPQRQSCIQTRQHFHTEYRHVGILSILASVITYCWENLLSNWLVNHSWS